MNAPKKIWMAADDAFQEYYHQFDGDIGYIRADIVDELVKALKEITEWTERYTTPGHPVSTVARAALKNLEESHD